MNSLRFWLPLAVFTLGVAASCGDGGGGSGGGGGGGQSASSSSSSSGSSGSGCLAGALLADLGVGHLMVGASMEDATAAATPFDGRYRYLSGGVFDSATPCASCASGCTAGGLSCANTAGCGWWGCWQYDQVPPGEYVSGFVSTAKGDQQIPMFTYYEVLQASGVAEGVAEVAAVNDAAFLTRYLNDFRFLLQRLGGARALVHIEPDFWGYAQHAGEDPHALPAAVKGANPTDCSAEEDSVAGLGRCMIAMVRKHAPAARVGLHASAWGTKYDALGNSNPDFDVVGEAQKLGAFLVAAGAGEGDFIVADMSDRDAAWYQAQGKETWWDETNATLPNFHQAFTWAKALAEKVNKPIVWWQIPVGNASLSNGGQTWKDNRVDYLFAHLGEVTAAHGAALFFGAGNTEQTTPETDGGNLAAKVASYAQQGGQAACP